ncbi:MAG: PIN/TRAM domain-containing protein [Acidimicrobiales bacterium]
MFVEIVRLFIVFFATIAGYSLGRGDGVAAGNGAVIGSTLGASVGYVVGGMIGRLLRRAMGTVERQFERAPAGRVLAGAVGAAFLGGLAALIGVPLVVLLPGLWGWPALGLLVYLGLWLGYRIASSKFEELLALAGLSTRPLVRAAPYGDFDGDAVLVDSSAIIDGRLLGVARAGFLHAPMLVPQFVLDEVQGIADASDPTRRRRGLRGLDMLAAMRTEAGVDVHVLDDPVVEHDEVDAKLVTLARRLNVRLLTVDHALQRVAEVQGVLCLNLDRLASGLQPAHVPGEVVQVQITREGRDPGQGVGFLDDGTMVVVGGAASRVGEDVEARVTGNAKTSVGTMLFASLDETPPSQP